MIGTFVLKKSRRGCIHEGDEFQMIHSPKLDRRKEKQIRALCRHHNDVL